MDHVQVRFASPSTNRPVGGLTVTSASSFAGKIAAQEPGGSGLPGGAPPAAVGLRECGNLAGINEGGIGEVFFREDL